MAKNISKDTKCSWKRTFFVNISIIALLLSPTGLTQDSNFASQVIETAAKLGKQFIENKRKQNVQRRQTLTLATYRPKQIYSKYFPQQCSVGMATDNFPENICRTDLPNDPRNARRISEAQTYKKIAIENITFYNNLLSKGQESQRPIGLECLEQGKKEELGKVQDIINRLKSESDRVKLLIQQFKTANQAILSEMSKINGELAGRRAGGGLNTATKDFSKEFSPACRDILSNRLLSKGPEIGFLGLQKDQSFSDKYGDALRAHTNINIWQKELLNKIGNIKKQMRQYGPQILGKKELLSLSDNPSATDLNQSITDIVGAKYKTFAIEYEYANKYLKENFNYSLPPADQDFASAMSRFAKGASHYFRKKTVHECVLKGKYKIALDPKKIIAGLKQKNASRGTNVRNYQNRLRAILNSDSLIEDKMQALKRLDKDYYGAITYTYKDHRSRKVARIPSQIFEQTINVCRRRVDQDQTFAFNSSGESDAKKSKKAEQFIKNLAKKGQTMSSDIGNAIYKRVYQCNNVPIKAGACNRKKMNPSEASFCIKHAETCSTAIRRCHKEVTDKISFRKQKMNALGNQWNRSVRDLITRQKEHLKQNIFPMVTKTMEAVKKYMPGATWDYQVNNYIIEPEMAISKKFGIEMLGGGNFKNFNRLPYIIEEKMVKMLTIQKSKLEQEYNQYIANKEQAMQKNLARWEELKNSCNQVETAMLKAADKYNRNALKQHNKRMQEVAGICNRYNLLRQNPAAGCGDGENSTSQLFTDSLKVSGLINPQVQEHLSKFSSYCNQYNNEVEAESDYDPLSALGQQCRDNDDDYDGIKRDLIEKIVAGAPEDLRDNVRNYFESSEARLSSELDSSYRRHIRKAKHALEFAGSNIDLATKLLKSNTKTKKEIATALGNPSELSGWDTDTSSPTLEELKKVASLGGNLSEQVKTVFNKDPEHIIKIVEDLVNNDVRSPASEADTKNPCKQHTLLAKFEAAKRCSDDATGCFEDKLEELLEESQDDPQLKRLDKSITSILKQEKGRQADALGELGNSLTNCSGIHSQPPQQGKEGSGRNDPLEVIRRTLQQGI